MAVLLVVYFANLVANGFIRNLTPSEIVQQVVLLKEKVNRIVYMGMGEPLFNYNSLIKSIHILRDRNGYNFPTDGITVSTVGPLTQLKKLREEHLKIQLTLSLHATNQTTRKQSYTTYERKQNRRGGRSSVVLL